MEQKQSFFAQLAGNPVGRLVIMLVAVSFLASVLHILFRHRKIQPNGFRWKAIRNEILIVGIGMLFTGFLLGGLTNLLNKYHLIQFNNAPAPWYVILGEYALAFVLFDTWFYWWHRLMHIGPMYTLVHKLHHFSTSPNLLTTFSVSPFESLINGGFTPLLTAAITLHAQTMPFLTITTVLMGLYVHSGYELLPRWWNKSWLSKWFITATFHDQHHKYFRWNFGGYTTVWDRICGTMRSNYESDFDAIKARERVPRRTPAAVASGSQS